MKQPIGHLQTFCESSPPAAIEDETFRALTGMKVVAEHDNSRLRQKVVSLIEMRLQTFKGLPANVSSRSLAIRLEKLLFAKSSSINDYKDLTTLKARCQALVAAFLRRRIRQREQSLDAQERLRKKALMNALGGYQKYQEVARMVDTVERLQRAPKGLNNLGGIMPKPMRDLLYNVSLVSAMDTTEIKYIEKLPWNDYIEECQSILENYYKWQPIVSS